jgi:hypothetical protein
MTRELQECKLQFEAAADVEGEFPPILKLERCMSWDRARSERYEDTTNRLQRTHRMSFTIISTPPLRPSDLD